MAEFLKRSSPRRVGGVSLGDVARDVFVERFPALCEFLVVDVWEDGKRRTPGTLLLCWGDGRFRGWLNDKDASLAAWLSADTLGGLLEALDAGLRDCSLEWRRAQRYGGKRG